MLLIYTEKITNRVKFTMGLYFRDILHVKYELTSDQQAFEAYDGPKMSYGKSPVKDELFLAAEHILFERKIKHIDLNFIDFEGIPAFFPVYNKLSALPFDPLAAGFYIVTRYEEYLPYKKDEYGRFSAKESIAFQKGFLHKPVVNIWATKIKKLLSERYANLEFNAPKYKFIPTIDIDAAWAYREKGLFRTFGGYLNALYHADFKGIAERTRVLAGTQNDPFDTYNFQLKIHRRYKLNPIYFVLFAEYGLNDKNIPFRNRKFQTLIKSLADHARVGIHPSFNSNFDFKRLKSEVERLSHVLNREINLSRQHFLMVQLPGTYRNLVNLDISDDYSMGFAAQPGFRAGICSSFRFYDLDLDTETKLRIHPFTYMEGTLKDYMNLSVNEASAVIKPLIKEVKEVNGTFISIWHNESLSNAHRWQGWQQLYEEMIQEAMVK
ncbi:MAG TPA: polysaccharide deacetylase family protein [Bacteroidales bacterium]|nr:polysaccharide deacetylase family protein [Bacteroidales bacterium]HRX98424.1 polysaccharide deacetylase family protein [Bacteroidales bacterium]